MFKLRAVWININYRYVKDELRYLFTNADLVALVHQAEYGPQVAELLPELPDLRLVVGIEDGSGSPARPRGRSPSRRRWPRAVPSGTSPRGPTTTTTSSIPAGRPACPRGWSGATRTSSTPSAAGSTPTPTPGSSDPRRWWRRGMAGQVTLLPIAPLMHGATQWSVMGQSFVGNRTILVPKFDPHDGMEPGRDREGQLGHDHRRRHGQATGRGARRTGHGPTTSPPCWPSPPPPPCFRRRSRTSSSATSRTS